MKGGKEKGKSTGPLLPRLHVNDREKRGLRAPPRNKMALYEQFSIPSERSNSSSASPMPIPSHKGSTLVTSKSPIQLQGCLQEGRAFSSSDVPAQPSIHLDKMVHSQALGGMSLNSTRMEVAMSSKRQADDGIPNVNRSAGYSLHLSYSSDAKKSRQKNFNNEDDSTVPTFYQSRNASLSSKNLSVTEPERLTMWSAGNYQKGSSSSSPNSGDKPLRGTCTNNVRVNDIKRNHIEQRYSVAPVNNNCNRIPDSGRRFDEPPNCAKTSSDEDDTGTVIAATASGYDNADVHLECGSDGVDDGARCFTGIDVANKGENSRLRKESCPESSLNCQTDPSEADKFNQESGHEASGSPEPGDVDRNGASEATLPVSISGMVTYPGDVVGVIGPKHFWKARRAIVNQQRIFAIQVFELHRLIKVQKLLAASPDVLKVDLYLSESPPQVPTMALPSENIEKTHQPARQEASSQKPNMGIECPEVNRIHDPPTSQIPRSEPSQVLSALHNRANPWCFQPLQNQWLLPVMSPSEGLIYKPYTRPCPPTAGFMANFYGNHAPLSFLPMTSGDFMNLTCSSLPYHQQPQIYFPSSYGHPIMKPIFSSPCIKEVSPLAGLQPSAQPSAGDLQSGSSCNVSNPRSEVISDHYQRSQASKRSKVQGTTLIIPVENVRVGGKDAMPSFPVSQDSNGTNEPSEAADENSQNRVIRVVPHNARLATESAARIFRSIQEERKQYDS